MWCITQYCKATIPQKDFFFLKCYVLMKCNTTQQHKGTCCWHTQEDIWKSERIQTQRQHTVWFHAYKFLEQVKLIYGERHRDSDYWLPQRRGRWKSARGNSGEWYYLTSWLWGSLHYHLHMSALICSLWICAFHHVQTDVWQAFCFSLFSRRIWTGLPRDSSKSP